MRLCLERVSAAATILRLELATLGDTIMEQRDPAGVDALGERVETPEDSGAGQEPSNSLGTLPLFEDYFAQPDSDEHTARANVN